MLVQYGGITCELVKTNNLQRTPVLSRDKTELLFMRTRLDLTMIYNPFATSYGGGGGNFLPVAGANPGDTDLAIRYQLMKPRQQLLIQDDNGARLHLVPAPGFDRDPDHGPRPIDCTVKNICNKTWHVTWSVEFATIECGGDGNPADLPPILSNRYSQAQFTSEDRLTRLTTQGETLFRADVLAVINRSADYFRSLCIPACPLGFQRKEVQVAISTTGTELRWSVVDQEMATSIGDTDDPRRGTVERFKANFSTSTMGPEANGAPTGFLMARFDGFAWGNKNSSRSAMIGWLARLAIERCAIPVGPIDPATQPVIMRATHSEELDFPYVELHLDVKMPPAQQAKQGLGALRTDFMGVDVLQTFSNDGRNPQLPNDANTRGTADVALFAAAIKEACSAVPGLPSASQSSGGGTGYQYLPANVSVTVSDTANLATNQTSYSTDSVTSGTYTEMSISTKYKTWQGKMQVPLSGQLDSSDSSSSGGGSSGGSSSGGGSSGGSSSGGSTNSLSAEDDTGSGSTGDDDDEPTCVVLTLGRPMTTATVTFEAERCSSPPIIPNPNVNTPGLQLLDETLTPMAVGLAPDGITPVYRIGGSFKYAVMKARKPGSALFFGVHPFTSFNSSDSGATLSADYFGHGLIDEAETNDSSGTGA